MGKVFVAGAVAATTGRSGSGSVTFLLIAVLGIGFIYFFMLRPQRQRQRQVMQTQRELSPGMRVRTTAGMYGTITSADDQDVTLEVAPGVEVRMMRRAILGVVPDGSAAGFAGTTRADSASPNGSGASGDSSTETETDTDTEPEKDERSAP
jgi:preprotein translocase subunit YajC